MLISRYFRAAGIILLSFLSAFFILLFSWLPKGGIYPFVSRYIWGPGLLWCAGAKLKVEGLENLKGNEHGIYYSNHESNFDIPALTSALPVPVYFIAKKEIKKIPIFGWGMWAIGMVFVDRKNSERARKSMEQAARVVKGGKSLSTFPEGTRSKTGELQAFKKGTFHLAKSGPIRLIPVAILGTKNIQPPGGKLQIGQEVIVRIGKPISEAEVDAMLLNDLAKFARDRITELQEGKPAYQFEKA